jgi:hypothetical protein
MQINLRQARRLERSILTAQQKLATELNEHQIRVSMHENFDETVQAMQGKIEKAAVQSVNLVGLRFAIRKAIETQNETSGINKLMNEEAKLKELAKIVTQATTHTVSDAEVKVAKARHEAMVKNGPTQSSYSTIDYIDVNGAVTSTLEANLTTENKSLQRRLVKIVEELGVLNTTTLIHLSQEDLDLLDKFDIVV